MRPSLKSALLGVGIFSCVANLLMLTGPLFMLQVYDRVLLSQSVPTLIALGLVTALLFSFFGLFGFLRARIMGRLGNLIDYQLKDLAFNHYTRSLIADNKNHAQTNCLKDVHQVRRFCGSSGALNLFDLPWIPIYMFVIFILHPLLGWVSLCAAILLIFVAVINERTSNKALTSEHYSNQKEESIASTVRRNAETLVAMGMHSTLKSHWDTCHKNAMDSANSSGFYASFFGTLTKTLRLATQSLILGVGAYLAIGQEISAGTMIAASIIFGRALAPVEQTIAQWRTIAAAKSSWLRLRQTLAFRSSAPKSYQERPQRSLSVKGLFVSAPGANSPIVRNISFSLTKGDGLAIVGKSGSGKSTFAKALVGAWGIKQGDLRLDGATFDQWTEQFLGRFIGYLPQDIELFDGSIAQNISRFSQEDCFDRVLDAAKLTGIHEDILLLPEGYDTTIGSEGIELSGGQRQRIALARAVFNNPFLIVLDEPNSNLDADGDAALNKAITELRNAGSIVIIVAHRQSVLSATNKLMILEKGTQQMFGPTQEVLDQMRCDAKNQSKKGFRVVQ